MTEALRRTRAGHIGTITCVENKTRQILEKDPSLLTTLELATLRCSLTKCKEQQTKLETLNQQINEAMIAAEVEEDAFQEERNRVDENDLKICTIIDALQFVIDAAAARPETTEDAAEPTAPPAPEYRHALKLPKLSLPTFSGKYSEWLPFFDLFMETVDANKSLSDIQKLQYLKTSLKDQPARLLAHLPATTANYEVAKNLLKERYANKRMIIRTHLEAIIKYPPLQRESSDQLRKLATAFLENSWALLALGQDSSECDYFWVYIISEKLDPETRRQWELSNTSDEPQTMKELTKFLEERARALDFSNSPAATKQDKSKRELQSYHSRENTILDCPKCSGAHAIYSCEQFKDLSIEEKVDFVKLKNLCFNCLRSGHSIKECKSKSTCRTCKKRHNTLLHRPTMPSSHQASSQSFLGHGGATSCDLTLLPTAMVQIKTNSGKVASLRALLDNGSQISCITKKSRDRLGLKSRQASVSVTGIGGNLTAKSGSIVSIQLTPPNHQTISTTAIVLDRVANQLPSYPATNRILTSMKHITWADPNFTRPGEVDMILGADVYEQIVGQEKRTITKDLLARNTLFGWVVSGRTQQQSSSSIPVNSFHISLDDQLKKFWELEELPTTKHLTPEETACEKLYEETTKFVDDRLVVNLPFKKSVELGDSLEQAKRRFSYLERRLDAKPDLRKRYQAFIQEFLDMIHMEEVPQHQIQRPANQCYYLPHHCVFKEDSTTTKLRVVFDGSAKTSNGISINEALMVGPVVQDDLFAIITRFRFYKIALTGDVEKMYRQVGLREEDRDFHRLLWRETSSSPLKHFRLTRVIYGVSCAAHLSTRSLVEIAKRTQKPHVAKALKHSFYVDDYLGGANSLEEAHQLFTDLRQELLHYGFPLRKWSSNSQDLLKSIDKDLRTENDELKLFSEDFKVKALGIKWTPNSDEFIFKSSFDPPQQLTKRNLLSATSKLFDPLGWLAPIVIQFKILMQQTWVRGLNWDDEVPDDLKQLWTELRSELPALNQLKIPRCVMKNTIANLQLHFFSDASEKAYAAVVYSRITDDIGHVNVTLLSSKTRVAPVKTVSLPRLELCGAELAAKLASTMVTTLEIIKSDISLHAWTDSTIVLQWLAQLLKTWSTFVANRVSHIQTVLPRSAWKHVSSIDNPADLASRGCIASQLVQTELWWQGPNWLSGAETSWPNSFPEVTRDVPEQRTNAQILTTTTAIKENTNFINFNCKMIIFTHDSI